MASSSASNASYPALTITKSGSNACVARGSGGGEGASERMGTSCADNGGIPTGGTRTLTTRRSWPTTASVNLVRLDTPGMIMKKRECVADEIQTRAQTYANQVRCLSEGTTAPLELFQPRSPAREHVGSDPCAQNNETHRSRSFTMPRNVADHHYYITGDRSK